jgi:hypothetical protein
MTDLFPLGLQQPFGQAAWRRVQDADAALSEFRDRMDSMWSQLGDCGSFAHPDLVVQHIISHILPIMDMNREYDCYSVCTAIRHLQSLMHPDDQPQIAHLSGYGDMFQGARKLALVTLLNRDEVKGTMLERYLCFPLELPAVYGRRTELFAIA